MAQKKGIGLDMYRDTSGFDLTSHASKSGPVATQATAATPLPRVTASTAAGKNYDLGTSEVGSGSGK